MKPVRIFSHVACDSPGYLGVFLDRHEYSYEMVCLDEGKSVPERLDDVAGLVFLGGAGDINKPTDWMQAEMQLIKRAVTQELPVLGVCLGAQMLSKALGGVVKENQTLEVGWHPVINLSPHDWFPGLPAQFEVFQWHAHTFSLPPGAEALANSTCAELQAFSHGHSLALQFHLEMTPEAIERLTTQYASDLDITSGCVQTAADIIDDLPTRTEKVYQVADVVYQRWLRGVYVA